MKHIFYILLLCILIENALSSKEEVIRMARAMKSMRNIQKYKERLEYKRKLEAKSTDSDVDDKSEEPAETQTPFTNSSAFEIDPEETDNSTIVTGNGFSTIQIKKIHNFIPPAPRRPKITYNVFFYFYNRLIVRTVILRVKIYYVFRLRNLQEDEKKEAYSVPSTCTIKPEFEDKVGTNSTTGENIDYDCEAPANTTGEITNVKLDTDFPLDLGGGETVDFEDINFDEDAAKEAEDIGNVLPYDKVGVLDKSDVGFLVSNFQINGTATPSGVLDGRKTINMEFIDYSTSKGKKNVTCAIQKIEGEDMYMLDCDSTIRTYISNITNAKSHETDLYFKINVRQNETGELVGTSGGNKFYRKNSSGLSGGSIAAIVIACVVAIIAASIIAIMVKKPSHNPPQDNTTIVDLKNVESI